MMQSYTLPAPPTLNRMYRAVGRGRVLKAKEYRAWLKEADALMHAHRVPVRISGPVKVHIVAFPKDKRIRDIDSYAKPLLDLLECAVLVDDSQVEVLQLERMEPTGEPHCVHIHVTPLTG